MVWCCKMCWVPGEAWFGAVKCAGYPGRHGLVIPLYLLRFPRNIAIPPPPPHPFLAVRCIICPCAFVAGEHAEQRVRLWPELLHWINRLLALRAPVPGESALEVELEVDPAIVVCYPPPTRLPLLDLPLNEVFQKLTVCTVIDIFKLVISEQKVVCVCVCVLCLVCCVQECVIVLKHLWRSVCGILQGIVFRVGHS